MPPTQAEVLEQINSGVKGLIESKEAFEARLKDIEDKQEQTRTAIEARLKEHDEGLKKQTDHLEEIEKIGTRARFSNDGTDNLLNELPDDLKKWVPRVAGISGLEVIKDSNGVDTTRNGVAVRMAHRDPVRYVAVGGWFQAKIKAHQAIKRARPEAAAKYMERADKLAEILGGFQPEAKVALQEDTADEGGDLVPTMTEAMIGWIVKDASVVRRSGPTTMQMTTKTHLLPRLANDFTSGWVSEEGVIGDSAPASPFSQGTLTAEKYAGMVTVSIELIQDNIINLMDFVMTHLLNIAGRDEDIQMLEGTGSPFTGLFSVAGTTAIAGGTNALDRTELIKLIYGGEEQSTMDGGVIYCHPWIVRDALLLDQSGTGSPLVMPFLHDGQTRPSNLVGVPVFPTAGISRVRTTNDTTVYHGNPAYLIVGDRMGVEFDINPFSETEFKAGQILLRLMRRVGLLVWVPGYFTKLDAVTVLAA